MGWRMRSDG